MGHILQADKDSAWETANIAKLARQTARAVRKEVQAHREELRASMKDLAEVRDAIAVGDILAMRMLAWEAHLRCHLPW